MSARGTDFSAGFNPTNCGEGNIQFRNYYIDGCSTNIQEAITSTNFTVVNVDIVETNKIMCVCDEAVLTLTNTCGTVTWEVFPPDIPGGPTVSDGTVTAGTNCGAWTVTARSALNTNCADSATVVVVRAAGLTGMGGTKVSDDPPTYIVCPVPTNSASPYMEICATSCPPMFETNLPPCWQMTGGEGTNLLCRKVDLRQPGATTITVSAGCSSNTVKIVVQDTNPPSITCPGNITRNTRPDDCEARVFFAANVTATDNCPGPITITCVPPSGSTFQKGTTTVTCTATDASGNVSAPCTFTVTIVDNQKPGILCPADIVVCGSPQGGPVTWDNPLVGDNCPGVSVSCDPASGSDFPMGETVVTCTATDASGNIETCTFTVTVVALGTSVEARRSSVPEEGFFPVKYGEHFEVGGTFEFEMLGGSTTPNPKLRYEVWDLDGIDDLVTSGAGIQFSYTWATGVDEGDAFVRFYCDANGDGERNWFIEDYIDSEEFWVMQSKPYEINVQYSDLITTPISSAIIQGRFDEAANLLIKKNSADDWRACVTFIVASATMFSSGSSRPDPVDVNNYNDCVLHLSQTDITFVNTLIGAGGATWGLNWHDIIIEWTSDFTWLERAIAHEMGHGVGLAPDEPHTGYTTPLIMQPGVLVPADREIKETDVDNYDGGP